MRWRTRCPKGPSSRRACLQYSRSSTLVFNEGYAAHTGDALVRDDLCEEAIRLGRMLAELMPREPEVLGLLALMEIQASRAAARTDADGNLILLADQDRARWDRGRIAHGLACLERAGPMDRAGPYRLQAAIAACHARAGSWEATDWRTIVALYEALAGVAPSPVVDLNRAVAIGLAEGPAAGLARARRRRRDGAAPLSSPACRPRRFPAPPRTMDGGGRGVPPRARPRREPARAGVPGGAARRLRGGPRRSEPVNASRRPRRPWATATCAAGLSAPGK